MKHVALRILALIVLGSAFAAVPTSTTRQSTANVSSLEA